MKALLRHTSTADQPAQQPAVNGTMLDWMSGNTPAPAPQIPRTIVCRFGDLIILAPDRFIIAEFAQYGGRGYFCDTSDLSSIEAILNCPEWSEDEINAAVAVINEEGE